MAILVNFNEQLKKILKEFPWLWAIRSSWYKGQGPIKVTRDDGTLSSLRHFATVYPDKHELWVQGESPACSFVSRLIFNDKAEDVNTRLLQLPKLSLFMAPGIPSRANHFCWIYLNPDGSEDFTILKPPQDEPNFNEHLLALQAQLRHR